jgi:hypothetical protein
MGNQNSTNKEKNEELKPKSISQILDYIATNYILTMDFKSLRKVYEKEYCDKLVILTSDIIQRYFTDMEIAYLAQRVKNGVEINETEKDKIIFFNKDELSKLDIQNSIKKKRICLSIAKFYIKIAHIFGAIVTTINPVYIYKDTEGKTVRASLFEKGKIPANTPRDILKLNICENRINSLKNKQDFSNISGFDEVNINPRVCSINLNDFGNVKTLEEEPGIPELMDLYYDDNYNYETGKFTGMSDTTKKIFQQDLKIFYTTFTGNPNVPPEISKFSDIRLRDYHKMEQCQGNNPLFETNVKGPLTNKLFKKYADNLKQMVLKTNTNQQSLLQIINQIFVYTIDPQTNKKQIRINPKLTEERLQEIVVETRALIIKLYLTCEIDYVNGLKIYEAIVDQKIFDTAQNQIKNLEKVKDTLIIPDQNPQPAELKEIQEINQDKMKQDKAELEKKGQELQAKEEMINNDNIIFNQSLEADVPPPVILNP